MSRTAEKICLAIIYAGSVVSLLALLFVDSDFFFPFISTRVFIFRSVVEIIILAYLLLNLFTDKFRPRINFLVFAVSIFIAIAAISSWLGGNFARSFWGDMERGEGLILWLHLLSFLIILPAVIRKKTTWLGLLDYSVAVAILLSIFGLGQAFHLSTVLATSGSRVDATFGNPAFFSTYLLFNLAFVGYLFSERRPRAAKLYYTLVGILFIYMIVATETRGTALGLAAGILLSAGLYIFFQKENALIKRVSAGLILLLILATASIYVFRKSSFIQDSPKLRRLASISLTERTAQTRVATWKAGWQGWKEKLWLGWGLENFDRVFNKYFPPIIYEDEGSQVWFDRAHNVIFDRGVTTGIFGLLVFLSIFLYPFYHFLRRVLKNDEERNGAIIFAGLLAAYLIQDLFIFESINVYIILFFTLAFWSAIFLPNYDFEKKFKPRYAWVGLFIIYGVAFWPIFNKVNLYPAKINLAAAAALGSNPQEENFFTIVDKYKKAIEAKTYGAEEYRLQYIEFVDNQLANLGEVAPQVKPVLDYTDEQVTKQLALNNADAKNYLLAMRHYNFTFAAYPDKKIERINQALSLLPRLIELSPTRPHVYQEAGYSHLYLFRNYKDNRDESQAAAHYQQALDFFHKAVDLQPKVVASYVNIIMLYLNAGKKEEVKQVLDEMDAHQLNWRNQGTLSRLSDIAKSSSNYYGIALFSEEMTKLNANNIQAWIELALAYAYLGDVDKATQIAERIKQFGPPYIDQANQFLSNLHQGHFRAAK